MKKQYIVSVAVDGRASVEVMADSPQEAYELAKEELYSADLGHMDVIKAKPVNAYDPATDTLIDY